MSSGIDMALRLTELLVDRTAAQAAQLMIEYDPQPPVDCGSVAKSDDVVMTRVIEYAALRQLLRGRLGSSRPPDPREPLTRRPASPVGLYPLRSREGGGGIMTATLTTSHRATYNPAVAPAQDRPRAPTPDVVQEEPDRLQRCLPADEPWPKARRSPWRKMVHRSPRGCDEPTHSPGPIRHGDPGPADEPTRP